MSFKEEDYQAVYLYLRSLHIHFLEAWVIDCMNYCKLTDPNISTLSLRNLVKEQWLLVNLKEMKVPSLPPNLISCQKIILPGKYVVQVESLIDCSRSCYSLFQKLQKSDLDHNYENTESKEEKNASEWNVSGNRCYIFIISDGVQDLKAMEYRPIKKIRTNDPELLPGFKMLISGPVECRMGMILLKEENVAIYGGEVDTFVATNNLRSLLLRKLNLNEEDYPVKETTNNETSDNAIKSKNQGVQEPNELINSDSKQFELLLSQNDDFFLSLPLEDELLAQGSLANSAIKSNNTSVDEKISESKILIQKKFKKSIDNSLLKSNFGEDSVQGVLKKHNLSLEDKVSPSPKKRLCNPSTSFASTSRTSDQIFKDHEIESFFYTEDWMKEYKSQLCVKNNKCDIKPKESIQTKLPEFFKSCSISQSSDLYKKQSTLYNLKEPSKTVCDKPFVYLKHIISDTIKHPRIYVIKAVILTLKKKITLENDEYNLSATVTDGSLSTDMEFSSKILENFLEYSPCEMQALIRARQSNSAIDSRIKETFKKAQEKFISLNCLMKIKVFPQDKLPLILSLEEVSPHHLNLLKERCNITESV